MKSPPPLWQVIEVGVLVFAPPPALSPIEGRGYLLKTKIISLSFLLHPTKFCGI